jgi:glycosyltransferase involved in cell wall biosynthesis
MLDSFAARLPELRRQHLVRPYRYALWAKAVAERLLKIDGDFDAIEFADCQAEGVAALGCPAVRARFGNAAWIVHAHTPMYLEEAINRADMAAFGRPLYHQWERQSLELADGVIVTSDVLASRLECVAPATVIPYPVDSANASVWLDHRAERVLLVGTVQPRKGVETWARSLNRVLRERPRATAMLIGPDTPTAPDGLSMAAHVQRLLDRRVLNRFTWTGAVEHDRVQSLIAESSLVIVPSRLEGFSFVAAEALLAGTPVIVSDQTGIAEHVPSLPRVQWDDVDAWAVSSAGGACRGASTRCVLPG